MGSSNNKGIILNQSNKEVTYMLHHVELTPVEASITKKFGAELAANMTTGASGGVKGEYCKEIKMVQEKVNCIYTVKPQTMTTVGLLNVDFDKIKFITITAGGKNLMESGRVSDE